MLLPTLPWGVGSGMGSTPSIPQLSLPWGQELTGGCTVALGSSAHPCSRLWEHGQMCSSGGDGVQQAPLPTQQQQGCAAFLPRAVTLCHSLPHLQTSTSVPRACTTAASSVPTPLGHTPATASRASAPLILLPASAWVSTCRQRGWQPTVPTHLPLPGAAVLPWEQGHYFLGAGTRFPGVLTALVPANPKQGGAGWTDCGRAGVGVRGHLPPDSLGDKQWQDHSCVAAGIGDAFVS